MRCWCIYRPDRVTGPNQVGLVLLVASSHRPTPVHQVEPTTGNRQTRRRKGPTKSVTCISGPIRYLCLRVGHKEEVVPMEGFEPPTHALRMRCSTS